MYAIFYIAYVNEESWRKHVVEERLSERVKQRLAWNEERQFLVWIRGLALQEQGTACKAPSVREQGLTRLLLPEQMCE